MTDLTRRIPSIAELAGSQDDPHLEREWLLTNGLGGYASGTLSGIATRRYHCLLIAALATPLGRTAMLSDVSEEVRLPGRRFFSLVGTRAGEHTGSGVLTEFRLEAGLPVWCYQVEEYRIEKRLLMPYRQNTVHVTYRVVEGSGPVRLGLRPAVHFRGHDEPVSRSIDKAYALHVCEDRYEISGESPFPPLRLLFLGMRSAFTVSYHIEERLYRTEQSRGYPAEESLWSPGFFRCDLQDDHEATLIASTEAWQTVRAMRPADAARAETERRSFLVAIASPAAQEGLGAELTLAADQFIVAPTGRVEDTARARATGDEVRTVIAGYHWFTDWGRDTMISLEGLTLITGRKPEAGWILRTFAHYIRDGLIPNLFPEGEREGLYHTADATLWFFHALDRYLGYTQDRATLRLLLPRLLDVVDHHLRGTRFGIHVDPADGLLSQGQEGYQLTWMDAKVGDWVVTPRRGKAVEINALWFNALCLLARWVAEEQGRAAAQPLTEHAERARESFNRRFWYSEGGYLYDVVDAEGGGDDPSCRPNQILAISLPHPVLDSTRWAAVLDTVRQRLLTPLGLRSLAPGSRDYKPKYDGDLRSRDAAYHQGTVWAWLIGPFIDAWLKVHPDDRAGARQFLSGFQPHLAEQCVGSISEIFDAEAPYTPRGCIAQAWSVAEVLRSWAKTAG